MTQPQAANQPPLPPSLASIQLPTGVHNKWLKFIAFGGYKTGKSWFLKDMPPPLLAIDCGEGGIGMYLPKNDPNYVCIQVTTPPQFMDAINWAVKNEKWLNSVAIDGFTTHWGDHMDWWTEELEVEEIKGGNWRQVKPPWKLNLLRARRATFHVGYSAWVKETLYTEESEAPGEKASLKIKPQAVPALERTVGYTIDMLFECGVKLNQLQQPTHEHFVRLFGGRRPLSVPPKDFHIGKTWNFSAKQPENVWDTVVAPLLPKWEENGIEHVGIDPKAAARAEADLQEVAQDNEVGRLLRIIKERYTSMADAKQAWEQEVHPALAKLPKDRREAVMAAHEKAKKALPKEKK
jgi:hypothetical protein